MNPYKQLYTYQYLGVSELEVDRGHIGAYTEQVDKNGNLNDIHVVLDWVFPYQSPSIHPSSKSLVELLFWSSKHQSLDMNIYLHYVRNK